MARHAASLGINPVALLHVSDRLEMALLAEVISGAVTFVEERNERLAICIINTLAESMKR